MKAEMINALYIQLTSDTKLNPANAIRGAIEVQRRRPYVTLYRALRNFHHKPVGKTRGVQKYQVWYMSPGVD